MKKLTFIIVTFLALSIIGCDFLKDDEKKKTAAVTTELEGTWKGNCFAGVTDSHYNTETFTGNSYVGNEYQFAGSSCTATLASVSKFYATISIGAAVTTATAKKIDWAVIKGTYTPKTTTKASSLNSSAFCGLTGWTVDVEREITGLTCNFGNGNEILPVAGDKFYDIFSIIGTSLYYGDSSGSYDGSSDALRPITLDTSEYYTKQ